MNIQITSIQLKIIHIINILIPILDLILLHQQLQSIPLIAAFTLLQHLLLQQNVDLPHIGQSFEFEVYLIGEEQLGERGVQRDGRRVQFDETVAGLEGVRTWFHGAKFSGFYCFFTPVCTISEFEIKIQVILLIKFDIFRAFIIFDLLYFQLNI